MKSVIRSQVPKPVIISEPMAQRLVCPPSHRLGGHMIGHGKGSETKWERVINEGLITLRWHKI